MINDKQEIKIIVEGSVNDIFKKIVKRYGLKSGDISPMDDHYLSLITNQLAKIVVDFYRRNS
jgi:hypothetical protein